jgi:hypothetical protein
MYNQIVMCLSTSQNVTEMGDMARIQALTNIAMADSAIACWDSKFSYNFWRPITAIREAAKGTGPSGLGDNNPLTEGDPTFIPLGSPASNDDGLNFTPAFPSYPSGHATFGGAVFEILRTAFGTDNVPFTFISDEYNGVTTDNDGHVRPLLPRSFASLSAAETENGFSRIALGIHFRFDDNAGDAMGHQIGDYVMANVLQPK